MFGKTPPYLPYAIEYPTLGGLWDEVQARCIWCGNWWFAHHHKDGVCHACVKKGRPTLTQIKRSANRKLLLIVVLLAVLVLLAIPYLR